MGRALFQYIRQQVVWRCDCCVLRLGLLLRVRAARGRCMRAVAVWAVSMGRCFWSDVALCRGQAVPTCGPELCLHGRERSFYGLLSNPMCQSCAWAWSLARSRMQEMHEVDNIWRYQNTLVLCMMQVYNDASQSWCIMQYDGRSCMVMQNCFGPEIGRGKPVLLATL